MSNCTVSDSASECYLTNPMPSGGFVVTPDGVSFYRMRVDNNGVPLVEAAVAPFTNDFVWTTPKTGPVLNINAISDILEPLYRIRVDSNGALLVEPFSLSGWLVGRALTSDSFAGDVLVQGKFSGIVCTTPDGQNKYRIRVDTNGALLSEQVS